MVWSGMSWVPLTVVSMPKWPFRGIGTDTVTVPVDEAVGVYRRPSENWSLTAAWLGQLDRRMTSVWPWTIWPGTTSRGTKKYVDATVPPFLATIRNGPVAD